MDPSGYGVRPNHKPPHGAKRLSFTLARGLSRALYRCMLSSIELLVGSGALWVFKDCPKPLLQRYVQESMWALRPREDWVLAYIKPSPSLHALCRTQRSLTADGWYSDRIERIPVSFAALGLPAFCSWHVGVYPKDRSALVTTCTTAPRGQLHVRRMLIFLYSII